MVDGPSNFMQQNIYYSYANIGRWDVFAQCFDGFVTPKLFAYALCRLGGTFEVLGMLIGLVERNNLILRMGGCMKFEMDVVALFGEGLLANCLGDQCSSARQTIHNNFRKI